MSYAGSSMKKIKSENHLMGNSLGGGGGGGGVIKSTDCLDSGNPYLSSENSLKLLDHSK